MNAGGKVGLCRAPDPTFHLPPPPPPLSWVTLPMLPLCAWTHLSLMPPSGRLVMAKPSIISGLGWARGAGGERARAGELSGPCLRAPGSADSHCASCPHSCRSPDPVVQSTPRAVFSETSRKLECPLPGVPLLGLNVPYQYRIPRETPA